MTVKWDDTAIDGVRVYYAPSFSEDHRGLYRELWHTDMISIDGTSVAFAESDVSCNYHGTLRGIHGDYETGKLITCLHGRFYLVILDMRKGSPTFSTWIGITLTDTSFMSVWVPPGCGNGHLVLSEKAIFHYMQTYRYSGSSGQFTIAYNDPNYNIYWPITVGPITSERDRSWHKKES